MIRGQRGPRCDSNPSVRPRLFYFNIFFFHWSTTLLLLLFTIQLTPIYFSSPLIKSTTILHQSSCYITFILTLHFVRITYQCMHIFISSSFKIFMFSINTLIRLHTFKGVKSLKINMILYVIPKNEKTIHSPYPGRSITSLEYFLRETTIPGCLCGMMVSLLRDSISIFCKSDRKRWTFLHSFWTITRSLALAQNFY